MSTRSITFLNNKNIDFKVKKYKHKERGAVYASQAIEFPLERTIKTLVVDMGSKGFVMVLMPGDKKLDLTRLAKKISVKKAAMADTSTAQRLTGYMIGGINPFGTKKKLPVVLEKSILNYDEIAINAG
ncbi:MAG: Cys-tRNA(Pro) deacylase [Deltaproteobacteria bacterium]|nr:Cys-tRNA(Pro) deacylase [Deltaproteobacteria bacterium]MBW2050765.1 Cys-tRNA(Pro) deacylase [Deltaproteobacteria bacterium]MBW2321975.1 Cys-tRNA(Pro) deacylase [Deltaproteobacteria bacterium]